MTFLHCLHTAQPGTLSLNTARTYTTRYVINYSLSHNRGWDCRSLHSSVVVDCVCAVCIFHYWPLMYTTQLE